jgi:hypothetical protein
MWGARVPTLGHFSIFCWEKIPTPGYISLSDYRPLRGIYPYPVFSALHSCCSSHEINTYKILLIDDVILQVASLACSWDINPASPLPSFSLEVWFGWGTLDPVHLHRLPRKWSDSNIQWLNLSKQYISRNGWLRGEQNCHVIDVRLDI